jgi:tagatose-6-phosphate ketose/aldose isomerase
VGPYLLVSFARSGNSPESCAVIDALKTPDAHHLLITCNGEGALARSYRDAPQVSAIVLSDATHDRSLVMTSSFTNMVLAASALGHGGGFDGYRAATDRVAGVARHVLAHDSQALAERSRGRFASVVYLGGGCRFGSARESALKMLEMTGGQIWSMPETYLGLRHGPMAAIGAQTLVVAHVSSEPVARAFELDLLRELWRKRLAARPVIVGCAVSAELGSEGGVVVDCGPAGDLADVTLTLIDALVGQLLAFFSCLALGRKPDSPSTDGVIQRVVEEFQIHRRVQA